jgi:hypothetical protein
MNDPLQEQLSNLTDSGLDTLEAAIHKTRAERTEARNASLPDYVWVTALQGQRTQTTLDHALELVATGGYEELELPSAVQHNPTDLVWVTKKQGASFHVTRG